MVARVVGDSDDRPQIQNIQLLCMLLQSTLFQQIFCIYLITIGTFGNFLPCSACLAALPLRARYAGTILTVVLVLYMHFFYCNVCMYLWYKLYIRIFSTNCTCHKS